MAKPPASLHGDDWNGLLAAACGLKKVESKRETYFATRTALVRAMIAAERQRSAPGLNSVANAFAAIGEDKAAAMVRLRMPTYASGRAAESSPEGWDCGDGWDCSNSWAKQFKQ